jgi:protein-tyrosine phosphatase
VSSFIDRINSVFGSKRGFVLYLRAQFGYWFLGRYRSYSQVPTTFGRVVFVCKGNVCRSPFLDVVVSKRLTCTEVTSIGLDTTTGSPAHPPIVKAAEQIGIDLTHHKATSVVDFTYKDKDLFVCTEPEHVRLIETHFKGANCLLVGLFGKSKRIYIHDPYSANDLYIQNVLAYLLDSATGLCEELNSIKG